MNDTAIVGGTFDILHTGHLVMLHRAFDVGDHVVVGVLSDVEANDHRDRMVCPHFAREMNVNELCYFLEDIYDTTFEVTEMEDGIKDAIESDAKYIVAGDKGGVRDRVEGINETRRNRGKEPLTLVHSQTVYDDMGEPLSATRIRKGIVDEYGNIESGGLL